VSGEIFFLIEKGKKKHFIAFPHHGYTIVKPIVNTSTSSFFNSFCSSFYETPSLLQGKPFFLFALNWKKKKKYFKHPSEQK